MSDNINNMDFKQLRNEVQLLRDELAIMRRKYEDILYNLDDENFSSRLVKQKGDMMTSITQTEESIKLQAEKVTENSQNISTLQITAEEIESTVFEKNDDGTKTSKIQQTADAITTEVTNRINEDRKLSSQITQTAESISTRVGEVEKGKFGKYSLFTQKADGFILDGEKTVFTGVIYLTDNNNNRRFSMFHSKSNGLLEDDSFERVLLHSCDDYNPLKYIIIGDGTYNYHNVYIGDDSANSLVATQGWVLENGGVAKFA